MPSRTRPQESHTPQVDLKFRIPAGKDNILPGQFLGPSQFMRSDKQAHDQVYRSNNRQAASVNGNRRRFQLRVGKTWMAVRGWAEVPERRLAPVKLCL